MQLWLILLQSEDFGEKFVISRTLKLAFRSSISQPSTYTFHLSPPLPSPHSTYRFPLAYQCPFTHISRRQPFYRHKYVQISDVLPYRRVLDIGLMVMSIPKVGKDIDGPSLIIFVLSLWLLTKILVTGRHVHTMGPRTGSCGESAMKKTMTRLQTQTIVCRMFGPYY